jgi:hypothetical protein
MWNSVPICVYIHIRVNFMEAIPLCITNKPHLFLLTHMGYFTSVGYPDPYTTCIGLYIDHHQARHYKNFTKEDKVRI